jgi:hypothetical protein
MQTLKIEVQNAQNKTKHFNATDGLVTYSALTLVTSATSSLSVPEEVRTKFYS